MKKETINVTKKITAGVLALGMLVTGIVVTPKQAEAAYADSIYYDDSLDISIYWKNDGTAKAPTKAGYVFGGWFYAQEEDAYLTPETIDSNSDGNVDYTGAVYAKFVPAQVLSVKAQNQANTTKDTPKTHVRIISSVDSDDYQKVGFEIYLANKTQLLKEDKTALETTNLYTGLKEGDNVKTVAELFGGVSKYLSVWQLNNVGNSNFIKIIYVRPYWITKDGTTVKGIAKYVHIEDDYNKYISVPINLLSGEKVAAGLVNVQYNSSNSENLQFVGFEPGRLLPEMEHNFTGDTIKMVGNVKDISDIVFADGIYANLRFKKPTADVEFNTTFAQFSNLEESMFEISERWDVKYDVK